MYKNWSVFNGCNVLCLFNTVSRYTHMAAELNWNSSDNEHKGHVWRSIWPMKYTLRNVSVLGMHRNKPPELLCGICTLWSLKGRRGSGIQTRACPVVIYVVELKLVIIVRDRFLKFCYVLTACFFLTCLHDHNIRDPIDGPCLFDRFHRSVVVSVSISTTSNCNTGSVHVTQSQYMRVFELTPHGISWFSVENAGWWNINSNIFWKPSIVISLRTFPCLFQWVIQGPQTTE